MRSHVTILAAGTRGDVQPFIALARGLLAAGHDVTLGANAEFAGLVEAHEVPFHPLSVDYLKLAATRRMKTVAAPMVRGLLDDAWQAAQDTDAIVYHPKTLAGPHLSERLGVPAFAAAAVPVLSPTRAFPVPGLVPRRLGGTLNRASYRLTALSSGTFRGTVDAWRAGVLDLPPAPHGTRDVAPDGSPLPKLYAYSEAVLPRPRDWGPDTIVTGYWDLPPAPGWAPDLALRRFLDAGPAPVYVGFGSMPLDDPARTTTDVVAALRRRGRRGLLAPPLDAGAADDMQSVDGVPHHWLFEHVAAVVHHGGAGTTGAALRAGRPAVIVPYAVDQPFWARVVHERGAAPRPVPPKRLDELGDALGEALGGPVAARAAELGSVLRREDGVIAAVARVTRAITAVSVAA